MARFQDQGLENLLLFLKSLSVFKSLTVLRKPVETGLYPRLITVAIAVIVFTIIIINAIIIEMMYMKQITLSIGSEMSEMCQSTHGVPSWGRHYLTFT